MASNLPIFGQIAWKSLLLHFIILLGIIGIFSIAGVTEPFIFGFISYFILLLSLRRLVPRNHSRGISLIKRKKFKEALEEFKKSYDFFKRNKWIDKYRHIVMLSSSRISYTEMDLLNIAFCYGQLGDGKKAKEFYEKTLLEFPDSEIAKVSLKMYEYAKNITY